MANDKELEREMRELRTLCLEELTTPIGKFSILTMRDGTLAATTFGNLDATRRWQRRWCGTTGTILPHPGASTKALLALRSYFHGELVALGAISKVGVGTEFQRSVWARLLKTPAGSTDSYGTIAAAIGRPSAVRAVGLANGANPIPVVVPCHRIVGSDGSLTGYGSGIDRKRWLLDHEARHTEQARCI